MDYKAVFNPPAVFKSGKGMEKERKKNKKGGRPEGWGQGKKKQRMETREETGKERRTNQNRTGQFGEESRRVEPLNSS